MDNQQIQIYILDGALLVLSIAVWILEKRRQVHEVRIERLTEVVSALVAKSETQSLLSMLFGAKTPSHGGRPKGAKNKKNKTKHTGTK